jgi:hypothetical protein
MNNILYNYKYLHGTESFFRSRKSLSCSRITRYFVEPEGSSPYSQEHSTGPYPEPDVFSL